MKRHTLAFALAASACATLVAQQPATTFGIGRAATPAEIAAIDVDVRPDGAGLPTGHGTAVEGAVTFAARCAMCHGKTGREGPNDRLVGRDPGVQTIGSYWPYATTVFDYIRRAMPPDRPGTLTDSEVYGLVAFLLAQNEIVPADATMDAASLPKVVMPALDRFKPDARPGSKLPGGTGRR